MDDNTKLKVEALHYASLERQKKQRFRQIILPIIISGVLVLAIMILAILSIKNPETTFKAGQITLIVVIFLAMLIGFLLIYILIKAIDALDKINQTLPTYTKKALGGVISAEERVHKVADGVVKPVLGAKEIGSKVKQVGKSFKNRMTPEGKE